MSTLFTIIEAFLTSAFGSDELQSYSADYTWQANQMAHAMMGFFLASVWYRLGVGAENPSRWCWLPPIVPLLKIPFDAMVVWWLAGGAFSVSWREFFWDKGTDLSFWWLGMYLAFLFFYLPRPGVWKWPVLLVWVVVSVLLFVSWTDQKKTFDRSNLPPGWIRASQYNTKRVFREGEEADKRRREMEVKANTYLDFIRGDGEERPIRHLIIRGGRAIDRSDLAIAFGTEFASRPKGVYYHTAGRLLEDPASIDAWRVQGVNLKSTDLRYPQCMVIDDFVGSLPDPGEVNDDLPDTAPSPTEQGEIYSLDQIRRIRYLFQMLRYRLSHDKQQTSTIWVLSCNPIEADAWTGLIKKWVKVEGHELDVVDLGPHKPLTADQPPRAGVP